MSWEKPGGNGSNHSNNNDGPPDLDEVFKKFRDSLFGASKSGGSGGAGMQKDPGYGAFLGLAMIAAVGMAIYDSVYVIEQAERGVITRFGAYSSTQTGGLHFKLPWPVDRLYRVNVDQNNEIKVPKQTVLTSDENVVVVDLSVQYNIKDAQAFLFEVNGPVSSLNEVAESALREVIGRNVMDVVLIDGRAAIANQISSLIQATLDDYKTGVNITSVNLEGAQPPEAVQDAFSDAIRAREDKEGQINEANAYSNQIIPVARGRASKVIENAKAYKIQATLGAEGQTSRFKQIYAQYKLAPEVTRERIYIESLETVLGNTNKVMMDANSNGAVSYLPLDQVMKRAQGNNDSVATDPANRASTSRGLEQQPRNTFNSNNGLGARSRDRGNGVN